ncbi:MAG TPA: hypothetical protein VK982_01445, partial [Bacteroidales bacterium]|nr:hypothetical protein [Bacteroidales bacterium]
MKFEITKEQILSLHNRATIFNKQWLEESFPEAFRPEIEVGKWYYAGTELNEYLYYITKIEGNSYFCYGFYGINLRNYTKQHCFVKGSNVYNNIREASKEE